MSAITPYTNKYLIDNLRAHITEIEEELTDIRQVLKAMQSQLMGVRYGDSDDLQELVEND